MSLTRRLFTSVVFIMGGLVTWLVLAVLDGFGASQAGMSASAASSTSSPKMWQTGFFFSYFLISAAGIAFCRRKKTLRWASTLAHLVLLGTFFAVCLEESDANFSEFLIGAFVLGLVTLVCFSPWFILWKLTLAAQEEGT